MVTPATPSLLPCRATALSVLVLYLRGMAAAMGPSSVASRGDLDASSLRLICDSILAEQPSLSSWHTATRPFYPLPQVSAHSGWFWLSSERMYHPAEKLPGRLLRRGPWRTAWTTCTAHVTSQHRYIWDLSAMQREGRATKGNVATVSAHPFTGHCHVCACRCEELWEIAQ